MTYSTSKKAPVFLELIMFPEGIWLLSSRAGSMMSAMTPSMTAM